MVLIRGAFGRVVKSLIFRYNGTGFESTLVYFHPLSPHLLIIWPTITFIVRVGTAIFELYAILRQVHRRTTNMTLNRVHRICVSTVRESHIYKINKKKFFKNPEKNGLQIWWMGTFPQHLTLIRWMVSEKTGFTNGRSPHEGSSAVQ